MTTGERCRGKAGRNDDDHISNLKRARDKANALWRTRVTRGWRLRLRRVGEGRHGGRRGCDGGAVVVKGANWRRERK